MTGSVDYFGGLPKKSTKGKPMRYVGGSGPGGQPAGNVGGPTWEMNAMGDDGEFYRGPSSWHASFDPYARRQRIGYRTGEDGLMRNLDGSWMPRSAEEYYKARDLRGMNPLDWVKSHGSNRSSLINRLKGEAFGGGGGAPKGGGTVIRDGKEVPMTGEEIADTLNTGKISSILGLPVRSGSPARSIAEQGVPDAPDIAGPDQPSGPGLGYGEPSLDLELDEQSAAGDPTMPPDPFGRSVTEILRSAGSGGLTPMIPSPTDDLEIPDARMDFGTGLKTGLRRDIESGLDSFGDYVRPKIKGMARRAGDIWDYLFKPE